MEYSSMALADLMPADYNPRTISDAALKGLKHSIERFGLVQPIILNQRSGRIVGGHQRVQALIALGRTHADVGLVDLSDAEEKVLNLALNNPAIQGEFTPDVRSILAELQEISPDLCLEMRLGEIANVSLAELREQFKVTPDLSALDRLDQLNGKARTCPACGHSWTEGAQ